MPVLPAIERRRARRAFSSRPVPADIQATLWEAARLAPSHGNTQPTRLLVAADPPIRDAVVSALSDGNRGWAGAAPLLVAIAAVPSHDVTIEDRDGTRRELWSFHAGLVAANLIAQATHEGLTAHPMGGFDESAVRAAFGAPDEVRVLCVVAIGFPGDLESLPADLQAREEAPRDRLPTEDFVVAGAWQENHGISARSRRRPRS